MANILMPKATAVWLIDNSTLSFEQIADYTGLHELEIQAIADGEVGGNMHGLNPVFNNQLTAEEIKRCEDDPQARLQPIKNDNPKPLKRNKGPRYTPISKRGDKPDAIAWVIKHYPQLSDNQIKKLIGTTSNTIESVRSRSYWNIQNIRPRHPAELGICTQWDLDDAVSKADERIAQEESRQSAIIKN